MRIYFLYTLLFLGSVNTYSQKGIYFKPLIENTVVTNQGNPYDITTQQGYTLHIRPLNCYYLKGWHDIGLHLGYRTKKVFAEIGVSSSGSNSGFVATGMNYLPNGNGYIDESTSRTGIMYTKYPLRMGVRLFGNDSLRKGNKKRWECFLYGGIDLLKRPGNGVMDISGMEYIINTNQDTVVLLRKSEVGAAKSYLATIGIMLKGYNKRNRNIFNISIHYSQGHDVMSWLSMKFINYDGTVYWGKPIKTKGSGLFINISKDIYPSNIFRKKLKI